MIIDLIKTIHDFGVAIEVYKREFIILAINCDLIFCHLQQQQACTPSSRGPDSSNKYHSYPPQTPKQKR